MVILANFAFTIDFVRRNADYTILAVAPSHRSAHFNGGNEGPNLAKWNQFGKRSVAVLGSGELIRQGNFHGMTALVFIRAKMVTGQEHILFMAALDFRCHAIHATLISGCHQKSRNDAVCSSFPASSGQPSSTLGSQA